MGAHILQAEITLFYLKNDDGIEIEIENEGFSWCDIVDCADFYKFTHSILGRGRFFCLLSWDFKPDEGWVVRGVCAALPDLAVRKRLILQLLGIRWRI